MGLVIIGHSFPIIFTCWLLCDSLLVKFVCAFFPILWVLIYQHVDHSMQLCWQRALHKKHQLTNIEPPPPDVDCNEHPSFLLLLWIVVHYFGVIGIVINNSNSSNTASIKRRTWEQKEHTPLCKLFIIPPTPIDCCLLFMAITAGLDGSVSRCDVNGGREGWANAQWEAQLPIKDKIPHYI